jgi:hypothetical protein
MRRKELCKHGFARKQEFGIQPITELIGAIEDMITSIVIRLVLPLQNYISSTTHLQNSSNSQLKVTESWDGSIVELLAFGSLSELNFTAFSQSDVPMGVSIRIGGNRSKEVFDLINGSIMMMRYQ